MNRYRIKSNGEQNDSKSYLAESNYSHIEELADKIVASLDQLMFSVRHHHNNLKNPLSTLLSLRDVTKQANLWNSQRGYDCIDELPVEQDYYIIPYDWYKDSKGIMQYDPKIKSQKDLNERKDIAGTYVGKTKTEISKRGNKAEYRKDGSIIYDNENDAYDRMKEIGKTREALVVYLESKILYLPDYKNDSCTSETASIGYSFRGNRVYDPMIEADRRILATMHTHISLHNGRTWGDDNPSASDIYKFTLETANVPFLTMGDNRIYGYYGRWEPRGDGKMYYDDVKYAEMFSLSETELYSGLKNVIKRNISTHGKF